MKISEKQRYAKTKELSKAKVGELQIAYLDENGIKKSGYIDLMEIDLEIGDKIMTFGELLAFQETNITNLLNSNKKLLAQVKKIDKFIKAIGGRAKWKN